MNENFSFLNKSLYSLIKRKKTQKSNFVAIEYDDDD